MTDLLGNSEFELIELISRTARTDHLKRIKHTRMVGKGDDLQRTIIDKTTVAVSHGHEMLVIEDGSYSFLLSRITPRTVALLFNLSLSEHRELFRDVECMTLNAMLSLENLQAHARRTWPMDRAGRIAAAERVRAAQ